MNILFALIVLFTLVGESHARRITLDIPDTKIKIAENDVVDFEEWINEMANNKISRSSERMVKEEIQLSIERNESIPAGVDAIIEKAFARPGYKNRREREAK